MKEKGFYEQLDDFFDGLIAEGLAFRGMAEKRLAKQKREIRKLDREEQAIQETLEELELEKSA